MAALKLGGKSYDIKELQKKYNNFLTPAFKVIVDGKDLLKHGMAITNVTIDTTYQSAADSFSIEIGNAFDPSIRDFKWKDIIQLGAYVEVMMGYGEKLEPLFYGLVTMLEYDYSSYDLPTMIVKGFDQSFIMMRGKKSRTWKKKRYCDVVREIGAKYLPNLYVDDTAVLHNVIEQYERSDFSFINEIALKCNYDFFVVGNSLYFRNAVKNIEPVVTLTWGKTLHSFTTQVNLSEQVNKVILRGFDKTNYSKVIQGVAERVDKIGVNTKTGRDIIRSVAEDMTTMHVYRNVESKEDADNKAQAILNKNSMSFISGRGQCIGIPEIRAGEYIKIDGIGLKSNFIYYIKEAVHTINSNGYTTGFSIGGNAI
ncbi:MAG: phage late control D family protein [Bacillota bacterium]